MTRRDMHVRLRCGRSAEASHKLRKPADGAAEGEQPRAALPEDPCSGLGLGLSGTVDSDAWPGFGYHRG